MNQSLSFDTDLDVAVIGAGYAGSLVALKATEIGLRVGVFDIRPEYPDHFRAEKLEPDQHETLERLGFIDLIRPVDSPYIDRVNVFTGKKRRVVTGRRDRGMDYQGTVNSFRDALRSRELLHIRKIETLQDAEDHCAIVFEDGAAVRTRLAVVATGGSKLARSALGLAAPGNEAWISTSFGFYVEPTAEDGFRFDAFNAVPDRFIEGLHYCTFFPIGGRTRVNIFSCWHPSSGEVRSLRTDPVGVLREMFPELERHSGPFRLSGKVRVFTTRYYRQQVQHLSSVILVGDEFQSVSPATGMGISKCVTDAEAAVRVLAGLPKSRGLPLNLEAFLHDPRKIQVDEMARHRWEWANELATSRSLTTRLRKLKRALSAKVSQLSAPILECGLDRV